MENLTEQDLQQIRNKGLTPEDLEQQIRNFEQGFPFAPLVKPATPGDGIRQLDQDELERYQRDYNDSLASTSLRKFVPASGAATRMFKALFEYLAQPDENNPEVQTFMENIEHFAFYQDLASSLKDKGKDLQQLKDQKDYVAILHQLLDDDGLGYGQLPKGLIKFHQYPDHSRTPAEEHLVEGAHYCKDDKGKVNIHFTVLPEHESPFQSHLQSKQKQYEESYNMRCRLDYSNQHESTDMVAVDMDNRLFRNPDGSLLFRPGGHGALLNNLNALEEDLIFIKNIDNVVPDRFKETTYAYKNALAGMLLDYQKMTFHYLKELESSPSLADESLEEMLTFLQQTLNVQPPADLNLSDRKAVQDYLKRKLNRPIRVCGMVKNQGEPGGGPFWVKDEDGSVSLQIVEKAQINQKDPEQKSILDASTHFNPVDLVCGVKDYQGGPFNLFDFRDPSAGLISTKSKNGKSLKAQELPGLWNGGMARWNTIFVEVPLITFNPVKTVNDLLREEHQQS
jgi:hypothetical protein